MDSPRLRRRFPAVLGVGLAVAAGILLALAIDVDRAGGPDSWLARHHLAPPYASAGKRVDIGPRSIYIDCRGNGSPTVILEKPDPGATAGRGAPSTMLSLPPPGRAPTTGRVEGAAMDASVTRSPRRRLISARRSMSPARQDHTWWWATRWGSVQTLFAGSDRAAVVGLMLVDAFNPDLETDWIHPLLGTLRREYETRLDGLRAHVSQVDGLDWPASEAQLRATALEGLPIEILVAPRYEPRLDDRANESIAKAWLTAFEALSPGHVTHTVAWGAGHNIQIDRPDLVIEATRRLIALSR